MPGAERETARYYCRAAPVRAMTDNGAILLSGHKVEREAGPWPRDPSQQVGAARRDPRRGAIPVALVRCQPFDDFPLVNRGVEDKWIYLYIGGLSV